MQSRHVDRLLNKVHHLLLLRRLQFAFVCCGEKLSAVTDIISLQLRRIIIFVFKFKLVYTWGIESSSEMKSNNSDEPLPQFRHSERDGITFTVHTRNKTEANRRKKPARYKRRTEINNIYEAKLLSREKVHSERRCAKVNKTPKIC